MKFGCNCLVRVVLSFFFVAFHFAPSWAISPQLEPKKIKLDRAPTSPTRVETSVVSKKDHLGFLVEQGLRSKGDLENMLRGYLNSHPLELGGLSSNRLRLDYLTVTPSHSNLPEMAYAHFVQQENHLDVEGSGVIFSMKLLPNKVRVMSIETKVFPDIQVSLNGSFTGRAAEEKAKEHLKSVGASDRNLVPLNSKVRFINGKWRALKEFVLKDEGLRTAVDHETGETFLWDAKVFVNVTGAIDGRGVSFHPISTGTNLNTLLLPNLNVVLGDQTSSFTNSAGAFNIPYSPTAPIGISAQLLGQWSDVNDSNLTDLVINGSATPGTPFNIHFNPTGNVETDVAQVNGYYHTTLVHNWVNARGVNPTEMNISIPTNVNLASTCNAYYTTGSPSINFYKSGGGCINTAYDTVVYHEYGHFVDDMIGGISWNDGLSEGWGDTLAIFVTGQPVVGEGFYGSADSKIRSGENNYIYNAGDEVHSSGQAWAGFNWDLRKNLIASQGTSAGIALAENLVIPVLWANSVDIPSAIKQVQIRDDNDGDLSNGTPHFNEIKAAAEHHGLGWVVIPDNTPPTVHIVSPTNGSTVGDGAVTVTTDATDDVQMERVDFYQDGVLQSSDNSAPYTGFVSTCSMTNGIHTVTATAFDKSGHSNSDSISVNVENGTNSPAIFSPSEGGIVSGVSSISATASLCSSKVELYIDGVLNGTVTSSPYSWIWDSEAFSNGPHTLTVRSYLTGSSTNSSPLHVTVSNSVSTNPAAYNATRMAPACATVGIDCDTGSLLVRGRAEILNGAEVNQPNTIGGTCLDGASGTFHADESIDRIKLATLNGTNFAPGKVVRVETTVYAWSTTSDFLDLFYTNNVDAPVWTYLATVSPTSTGTQSLTATYTLPSGNLQAVRAQFRYGGTAIPCTNGSFDDHDDLIFAVASTPPPDTTPPTASITYPATGTKVSGNVTVHVVATDNVAVAKVELYKDGNLFGTDTSNPYDFNWNAALDSNGTHTLKAIAYDTANLTFTTTNSVIVDNNRPPTVSLNASPTSGKSPLVVTLTATASDQNQDPIVYNWTFGDGTIKNGGSYLERHTYTKGNYQACVTVNDGRGGSASSCRSITAVGKPGVAAVKAGVTSGLVQGGCVSYELSPVDVEGDGPVEIPAELATNLLRLDGGSAGSATSICLSESEPHRICFSISDSEECWKFELVKSNLQLLEGDASRFFVGTSSTMHPITESNPSTESPPVASGGCGKIEASGAFFIGFLTLAGLLGLGISEKRRYF